MSIYRRDEISPEWEPAPWPMAADAADAQERGFHARAQMPVEWQAIPWAAFPRGGIFGHPKAWLSSIEATCFATTAGEDMLLIDSLWSGWPDPPRWGLASRPRGANGAPWMRWGHFADLPRAWTVPGQSG